VSPPSSAPRPALLWACFAGCVAIWSLTWVAIRAGASGAAPIGNGALRATLAAGILAGLAFALRATRPSARQAVRLAVAGVVFVGINFMLVYTAAQRIDGSLAALLYATLPLQSALIGPLLVARERLESRVLLGALLGAVGVGIALQALDALDGSTAWGPVASVLLGATASAVGAGLVRRVGDVHPLWVNTLANLGGAAVLWLGWATLERGTFLPQGASGWAGFTYMVLGASVVVFLLYFVLLRSWSTARAAYSSVAASAGAIAVGVALGEPFTASAGLGAALVLVGGVLVLARRRPAAAGTPRPAASLPRP
jgi:drug/metabolite transporter (DMT)-like permease